MIEKIIEWLKKSFGREQKKRKYIIGIALLAIMLIILGNLFTEKKEEESPLNIDQHVEEQSEDIEEVSLIQKVSELETGFESELVTMLNQIQGVSEAEVMINVDSTNVQVYEKDLIVGKQTTEETDKNGGERIVEDESEETKLVYIRQGDQEVPVLVKTKKPEVRGVFIIAKGADNPNIQKWIIEAVSKVLDVPTYKISVMPK